MVGGSSCVSSDSDCWSPVVVGVVVEEEDDDDNEKDAAVF